MTSLTDLPPEVLTSIIQGLPQHEQYLLCLTSRRLRSITEPLLYRLISVNSPWRYRQLRNTVMQNATRRKWIKSLQINPMSRRIGASGEYGIDILELLPDLIRLEMVNLSPDEDFQALFSDVVLNTLSPSHFRQLSHCYIDFVHRCSASHALCLLYLPSLRYLQFFQAQFEGGVPQGPYSEPSRLDHLAVLDLFACTVDETTLKDILLLRQTRTLRIKNYGRGSSIDYTSVLEPSSAVLESLQIYRWYIPETAIPISFSHLAALHTLYVTPDILFAISPPAPDSNCSHIFSPVDSVVPPNVHTIVLDVSGRKCNDTFFAVWERALCDLFERKERLVPNLRRIEFRESKCRCFNSEKHSYLESFISLMEANVKPLAKGAGVELVVRRGTDLIEERN